MGIRRDLFKKKWLILGLVCALIPFYQNMSPFELGQEVDIRDYAPSKPKGYFDDPAAGYFPHELSGGGMGDIGNQVINHNFNEVFKRSEQLGESIFSSDSSSFVFGESENLDANLDGARKKTGMQVQLLNPSTMRLVYRFPADEKGDWTMACQNKGTGVNLQMHHPLSPRVDLGISHETEARTSQLQMGITW